MKKLFFILLLAQTTSFAGFEEAKKYYDEKNYEQSLAEVTAFLKDNPSHKDALVLQMNIHRSLKNEISAIRVAKKLHQNGYSLSVETMYRYANLAHDNKEHELALYFAKVCNQMKPNSPDILNLMGVSYFYLKKYRISLVAFKAAVSFNGQDSIYWANLARSYESLEEYEKALTYYQMSLKYEPDFRRSLLSVDRVKGLLQNQRQN